MNQDCRRTVAAKKQDCRRSPVCHHAPSETLRDVCFVSSWGTPRKKGLGEKVPDDVTPFKNLGWDLRGDPHLVPVGGSENRSNIQQCHPEIPVTEHLKRLRRHHLEIFSFHIGHRVPPTQRHSH
ncbi:hypothetical protein LSTR_LSTR012485 [Laodelphax striatellus]|uniref:Uncharacterized protein n=1 Tax=Laodelphax striatellus TaxID=195883 RepID=A0A482XLH4_LAOST|nr:hypothetical protein LSTR_LSTR012485 [Laodelphax striatellus]